MGEGWLRVDEAKNRIVICLQGRYSDSEVTERAQLIYAGVCRLKPGFEAVTDISSFEPASLEGAQEIIRVQSFVKKHGVRRIIRVVSDADLRGRIQFQYTTDMAAYGPGVRIDKAGSIEEAERILDEDCPS